MALVRIDFCDTQAPSLGVIVAQVVNRVMVQVLSVPESENFVICQSHPVANLLHRLNQLASEELSEIVFIQITLNTGRSAKLKATFYDSLTQALLVEAGLKSDRVFVNLVEVAKENWSFGRPVQ